MTFKTTGDNSMRYLKSSYTFVKKQKNKLLVLPLMGFSSLTFADETTQNAIKTAIEGAYAAAETNVTLTVVSLIALAAILTGLGIIISMLKR